jgi:hypothetical protein
MDALIMYSFLAALVALPIIATLAYAFAQDRRGDGTTGPYARLILAGIIVSVGIAAFFYRAIYGAGLGQTSALFVGIPTILSLACVFVPTRSATGVAMKSVTVGLLFSMVFLGEGVLCVLMSAPLFFAVALAIGSAAEQSRTNGRYFSSWIAFMAIVPMSLEGVTPLTTIDRSVTVSETRLVAAAAADVAAAIEATPRFDRPLPRYLAMGFPRPTSTRIEDGKWIIRMRGGEMRLNGMEPRAGDLVLERDDAGANFVSWRTVSDDSHMTHFLNWEASRVEWQAVDQHTTRVTWTLRYRRGLDPAWYFGPMQRYAMRLAAGYLIESVATP